MKRCSRVGADARERAAPQRPHEQRQRRDFRKARAAREHAAHADEPAAVLAAQFDERAEDERHRAQVREEPHVAELGAPPHVGAGDEEHRQKHFGREIRHAEPLGEHPREERRDGSEHDRDRRLVRVVAPERDRRQHEQRRHGPVDAVVMTVVLHGVHPAPRPVDPHPAVQPCVCDPHVVVLLRGAQVRADQDDDEREGGGRRRARVPAQRNHHGPKARRGDHLRRDRFVRA